VYPCFISSKTSFWLSCRPSRLAPFIALVSSETAIENNWKAQRAKYYGVSFTTTPTGTAPTNPPFTPSIGAAVFHAEYDEVHDRLADVLAKYEDLKVYARDYTSTGAWLSPAYAGGTDATNNTWVLGFGDTTTIGTGGTGDHFNFSAAEDLTGPGTSYNVKKTTYDQRVAAIVPVQNILDGITGDGRWEITREKTGLEIYGDWTIDESTVTFKDYTYGVKPALTAADPGEVSFTKIATPSADDDNFDIIGWEGVTYGVDPDKGEVIKGAGRKPLKYNLINYWTLEIPDVEYDGTTKLDAVGAGDRPLSSGKFIRK
jgi:hypothetical protein